MTTGWERLGLLLLRRRVHLGYPNRSAFARDKGLKNDRTLSDLEKAKRTNFGDNTLAHMEVVYEWAPGSIERVLAGGEPTPIEETRADTRGISVRVDLPERSELRSELHQVVDGLSEERLARALNVLKACTE